jgi:putative acetyltransferase
MIREYEPKDTDALISIWEKANAMAHPFLLKTFVAQVKEDIRNVYLPNAETWVLEENRQPAGFIAMIGNEIGGLFLDPSQHGKAMVDYVVARKARCGSKCSKRIQSVVRSARVMASSLKANTCTSNRAK